MKAEPIRSRQHWILLDTVILGIVGALSAQLFTAMLHASQTFFLTWIAGYQAPGLPEEGGVLQQVIGPHGLWWIPLVTTLGGLLAGLLVFSLAPEAEGHGTDTVVHAFHQLRGCIRTRVPPLKMIASAITIGSGGAAGREGPTALITAGVGSVYATLDHRSEENRRLLVLIGMAAGLSAIFRSPIGTALFAIEVLYNDMELDANALLYTLLGSVVAYTVNGLFVGWQPLFAVPATLAVPGFGDYVWYILLGLLAGGIATLLPLVFYGMRDLFHRLPLPPHIKPAIGGLGVGLLALQLPQVLGGGYGWIQHAIDGRLTVGLLLALLVGKMLAFALTVSSGGSGGVFAPGLFVGAMLGGVLAQLVHQPSAAFVVVSMAAVFGAAARVPVATLLMVTEMTGGYHLLVPAALAVTLSYLLQVELSRPLPYRTLYEAQVTGRVDSPAHQAAHLEAAIHLLEMRGLALPATISHIKLPALVASGIPIDLPGGKHLVLRRVQSGNPAVGTAIRDLFPYESPKEQDLVAVFRQNRTLLPYSKLILQPGDRLLLITSKGAARHVEDHLKLTTAAQSHHDG